MTAPKRVLAYMRIAGYHADKRTFTRLYVENRISRASADAAWREGVEARKRGLACTCVDCTTADLRDRGQPA